MTSEEMKNICIEAINAALVSRGANKGQLKAACPRSDTDAAAAWQAMTGHANPYKMGIGVILFFTKRQQAIFDNVERSLQGVDVRTLDRDRVALEQLGVW